MKIIKSKLSGLRLRSSLLKKAFGAFVVVLPALVLSGTAYAAGDASFGMSTGGSTTVGGTLSVTIYFSSQASDGVTAAQATVSYPTSLLQWQNNSGDGSFNPNGDGLCPHPANTGGGGTASFACATTDTLSGSSQFVTMNFTVIGSGSATIRMESKSDIDNGSGGSVWDGSYPSIGVTLSAPSQQSSGAGSNSSGGGSSGGASNSGSTTKAAPPTGSSTPAPTQTPTTTPTTNTQVSQKTPTHKLSNGGTSNTTEAVVTVTVDDSSGNPIEGAKVVIDGSHMAYTNSMGQALVTGVPSGTHQVTVTASGKTTSETMLNLSPNEDKNVSLKLSNSTSPVLMGVFVVVGLGVLSGAGFGFFKLYGGRGPRIPLHMSGAVTGPAPATSPTPAPAAPQSPDPTPVPAATPAPATVSLQDIKPTPQTQPGSSATGQGAVSAPQAPSNQVPPQNTPPQNQS